MFKRRILPAACCCIALCVVSEMDKNVSVQPVSAKKQQNSDTLYVNMQQAMMESKQGQVAQGVVEAKEKEFAQLAQQDQQRMVTVKNELDTKGSMLNPDERRKLENEFNNLQRDYQGKMQNWRDDLQYVMQRETDVMIEQIQQAAKVLADNEKKDLVVDVPTGRVLFIREDRDSTRDLVTILDNQYMQKNKAKQAAATNAPVAPTAPKSDAAKVAKV